jgi:hypothetical protein
MIRPKSQKFKIGHDGILSNGNFILIIKNNIFLFQLPGNWPTTKKCAPYFRGNTEFPIYFFAKTQNVLWRFTPNPKVWMQKFLEVILYHFGMAVWICKITPFSIHPNIWKFCQKTVFCVTWTVSQNRSRHLSWAEYYFVWIFVKLLWCFYWNFAVLSNFSLH